MELMMLQANIMLRLVSCTNEIKKESIFFLPIAIGGMLISLLFKITGDKEGAGKFFNEKMKFQS